MTPNLAGILVAALAFAITFLVVRVVARRLGLRRQKQAEQVAQKGQSRQVRRARQRKRRA